MVKAQFPGVQELTMALNRLSGTVQRIADQRVMNVFHMDPNLVCSSRFQSTGNQRVLAEPFQYSIVRYGVPTVTDYGLLLSIPSGATQWCVHRSPVFL